MRTVLVLLILLLAPSVGAAWRDQGEMEPGPQDLAPSRMWSDASATEERVYFNVRPTLFPWGLNPNLVLLGTQLAPPLNEFRATLGIWRDCNGDEAIGASDVALVDYPASLGWACAPGTPHNDGTTVRELIPLDDSGTTRIWGDADRSFSTCGYYPLPEGSTARAGGMLRVADCILGGPAYAYLRALDPSDGLGLRAALETTLPVHPYDDPYSRTPGLLQHDEPPAFTAWDCAADAPAPAVHDARGSYATGAERAVDALAGDCDPATSSLLSEMLRALDAEPDGYIVDPYGRQSTDLLFEFDPDAGGWYGEKIYVNSFGATSRRITLGQSWTFYAHVDVAQIGDARLPSNTTLPYGFQYCPGWTFEFDCDPERWYPVTTQAWPARYLPLPGDPLHLVDRDCYGVREPKLPWPRGCP